MSDQFLYKNRPAVREEFRNSLYARLMKTEEREHQMQAKRLFGYSMIGLLITLVLVFTISAPVRASALNWIRQIAGFNVAEVTESPLAHVTEVPSMVTVITPQPIAEIKNAPFAFSMPQFIPAGFVLSQDFAVAQSKEWVLLSWTSQQNALINLLVEIHNDALVITAGKEGASETSVNGQPALLIRGGWTSDQQWNDKRGLELEWLKEGLRYDLKYVKRGANNEIVPFDESEIEARLDELMKIAESIK
jgi:hypothetical protein